MEETEFLPKKTNKQQNKKKQKKTNETGSESHLKNTDSFKKVWKKTCLAVCERLCYYKSSDFHACFDFLRWHALKLLVNDYA